MNLLGVGKLLLGVGINLPNKGFLELTRTHNFLHIIAWGLGQILLGVRNFETVAWGCAFQDHICLGWLILTTFLLGVLLGVDFLWAVRQGCIGIMKNIFNNF